MSFAGAIGHACGLDFKAAEHLRKHPGFAWQQKYLHDVRSRPWTVFQSSR